MSAIQLSELETELSKWDVIPESTRKQLIQTVGDPPRSRKGRLRVNLNLLRAERQKSVSEAVRGLRQKIQEAKWPVEGWTTDNSIRSPVGDQEEAIWIARGHSVEGPATEASVAMSEWRDTGALSMSLQDGGKVGLDIIDFLGDSTMAFVATGQQQLTLRQQYPGLDITPSAALYPQALRNTSLTKGKPVVVDEGEPHHPIHVTVVCGGVPVEGAVVQGFLPHEVFVRETTDAQGVCTLRIPLGKAARVEVTAAPVHSYWTCLESVKIADAKESMLVMSVEELRPQWLYAFEDYFSADHDGGGEGVRVAVIDTGVERDHPFVKVKDGASFCHGEPTNLDWNDTVGHGTMVAGVIAAQGDGQTTVRGLAPNAEIYAYRVFARGAEKADEAAVAQAIRQAVKDGCHLINLSLGGPIPMLEVQRAIDWARTKGVICIAAAGNGGRRSVSYPATYPEALAVSAMARIDGFPENSDFILMTSGDSGTNPADSVAIFTNVGNTLDFCAPGVGIVSTWLGGKMAAMNGTSFAAPVVTALVARALSNGHGTPILEMEGTSARAEAIRSLATQTTRRFGFDSAFEGHGIPAY